jgi:hypothetical protein
MLATVVVMPGGIFLLLSVALVVVMMRTARGQRVVTRLGHRLPRRLRAPAQRLLAAVVGEKIFPAAPPAIHTA